MQHRRQHCPDFSFFFKSRRNLILFQRTTFHIPQDMVFSWNTVWEPWVRASVLSFFPRKTLFITSVSALISLNSLSLVPSWSYPLLSISQLWLPQSKSHHSFIHSLILSPSLPLSSLLWLSPLTALHVSPLDLTIILSPQSSQGS